MLFSVGSISAQHKFHRIFSNNGYDRGESIAELPDSSFIVTGTSTSFGSNSAQVFLLKIASDGTYQWSKSFGGVEIDHGKRVFVLNDGFMVFGHSNDNASGNFDFQISKTDLQGNLLCIQTIWRCGLAIDF